MKQHKGQLVNGTKENTFLDFNNRILSQISNHVNHIASNGTVDTTKIKQPIEQNDTKTNGHSDHDNRTIIEKLNDYRKSIR